MSPAYNFSAYLDGSLVTLGKRERPQVVLEDGAITALFNGARGPHDSKFNGGNTFNMVTEICGNGPAVNGVCPGSATTTATEQTAQELAMANVTIGRGGYPRGVQLLSGVKLACVGMDVYTSSASSPSLSWSKLSTVLADPGEGVDLGNCNLAQLPSGRILASVRAARGG
jgi:hypothetical protein